MYVLFESIDRKKVEDMEKTLIGLFSLRGDNKEPPKETYGLVVGINCQVVMVQKMLHQANMERITSTYCSADRC